MVSREANILVVGPPGSGRTLVATALLSAVNSDERMIVVESVPEISVTTAHLEKLIARPGGIHGEGGVTQSELIRAALDRSPHRIAVGEIRGEEARAFLQVLESGFTGSIATLFANSAHEGLWRFVDLIAAVEKAPMESIVRRVARSVQIVVSMTRVDNGPCLSEIVEVAPGEDGRFDLRRIVAFDGVAEGKRRWRLTNEHSVWVERIAQSGMALTPGAGLLSAVESSETESQSTVSQGGANTSSSRSV